MSEATEQGEGAGTQVIRREDRKPQEAQDRSALPSGMLEPIAEPGEIVRARAERSKMITEALEDGRDYGSVSGIPKPFLHKPGAERLTDAFGCYPRFTIIDSEVDHDRRVEWEKRSGQTGTSRGLYRYVVSCELVHRASGIVVGNGIGVCSSMEDKYVESPRNSENTIAKMAKKRAHVDAALSTFGLSEMFTQDEDYVRSNGGPDQSKPVLDRHPPKGKHTDKTWAEVATEHPGYVKWAAGETDWLTEDDVQALRDYVTSGGSEGERSGDEPSGGSAPSTADSPKQTWMKLWHHHRGVNAGERVAWEGDVLADVFGEDAPVSETGKANHTAMNEAHYKALTDRLMDEVEADSQTEAL